MMFFHYINSTKFLSFHKLHMWNKEKVHGEEFNWSQIKNGYSIISTGTIVDNIVMAETALLSRLKVWKIFDCI